MATLLAATAGQTRYAAPSPAVVSVTTSSSTISQPWLTAYAQAALKSASSSHRSESPRDRPGSASRRSGSTCHRRRSPTVAGPSPPVDHRVLSLVRLWPPERDAAWSDQSVSTRPLTSHAAPTRPPQVRQSTSSGAARLIAVEGRQSAHAVPTVDWRGWLPVGHGQRPTQPPKRDAPLAGGQPIRVRSPRSRSPGREDALGGKAMGTVKRPHVADRVLQ